MIHELDPDWLLLHTSREKLPELRLISAILEDAVELIKGEPYASLARERIEALAWVRSDRPGPLHFGFVARR